jgi:hypothetical protein
MYCREEKSSMPIRMAFFGVIGLIVIALAGSGRAAGEGPYPIWWSAELELEGLDQVEARLRRDLWLGDLEGMNLYVGGDPDGQQANARDCASLIELSEAGYHGPSNAENKVRLLNLAYCRAIALLGRTNPARVSHIRDFVMSAAALDHLPALVDLYPSCEFICYAVQANQRGIPFTKFEMPLVVDVENDDKMTVWTTGWMVILTVLGRGDVTGDGIDDMLLLANGGATEGTYGASRLYLLTRDGPGSVLRAIDAERELCPHRGCSSLSYFLHHLNRGSPPPSPEDIGGSASSLKADGTAEQEIWTYPVWWSVGFKLDGLDQVDARLRRSFWPGMDLEIQVSKGSYEDYIDATAKNCVELEALTQAGYGLPGGGLHYSQMHHLLRCRTISLLATVQPARESYLRDFAIDDRGTRELLLAFGLVEQGEIGKQVSSRGDEVILTGGLGELLVIDLPYGGNSDVWAEKGRVLMRIEARGDFTGDSIEDLLFSTGARLSRYRPYATDLCLVTREAPDAPLRLIEVAPYSCRRLGRYGRSADDDGG